MTGRRLAVAVLDEDLPYPPTTGKRLRSYHLLTRLARRHTLYYIARTQRDQHEAERAVAHLRGLGIIPVLLQTPIVHGRMARATAALCNHLGSALPVSVQIHSPRALRHALCALAKNLPIDLWHCEWSPLAYSLRALGDVPQVIMAHNVEALIWRRYAEHTRHRLARHFFRRQWEKYQTLEAELFASGHVITVSQEDSALAQRLYGAAAGSVIDNGVDGSFFRLPEQQRDPRRLLFLGSLDWRPNIDALEYFFAQVFPGVLQRCPEIRVSVVGRQPSRSLLAMLRTVPQVDIYPNALDVKTHIATSGLMVVPLRIGGGSRLKIIEAAAAGLPVLTTSIGCEGLRFSPDEHITVADSATALEDAIVRSLSDYEAMMAKARTARTFAAEHYDWDQLAGQLEQCWYHRLSKTTGTRMIQAIGTQAA